ncbi:MULTISPECIES: hypothetical protein [Methylococcus]|jgi:hypothetical protein|uniref:hypothetical protein n=1 Tax=Methylococcus TaxID=413 RepID=UPI001C530CCA|nr:hypothetical protein [Methylococcus capsulatus]QXP92023.1 hypothetical protein KW114_07845 [Methylococcus capsulatus]QXP93672.1 hypothetical protein KW113_00040 [Methylococcus capsulatus]
MGALRRRRSQPSRLRVALAPEDWAERLQIWLSLVLQALILGVFIGALYETQWLVAFTSLAVLALTFLPAMIARQFQVQLPVEFTFVTCLFLYASFGLGEVAMFYERFWWWDLLLHSVSALIMGLLGFLLIYAFHSTHRVKMAPFYVAITAFCYSMSVGALWEIFEFLMDQGFGFNMQKSAHDTMTDLIVDAAGAFLAAWMGYHYVKNGDSLIADRLVRRFVARNPRLFPPRRQSGAS